MNSYHKLRLLLVEDYTCSLEISGRRREVVPDRVPIQCLCFPRLLPQWQISNENFLQPQFFFLAMYLESLLPPISSDKLQFDTSQNDWQLVDSFDFSSSGKTKDKHLTMEDEATKKSSMFRILATSICGIMVCIIFMASTDWRLYGDIFNNAPLIGWSIHLPGK
jgi:hypothetical protein